MGVRQPGAILRVPKSLLSACPSLQNFSHKDTKTQRMKILLINIDGYPNLALLKIEKYHLDKGDEVVWDFPLYRNNADNVYVSCIFSWNKDKCREWEGYADIGGSGYDLHKELPPEIESVKPYANFGFTTRGCIRKCSFCIVPEKEGRIRIVGDLLDLWDGKFRMVTVLDNNILAVPEHFKKICRQARENKVVLDFNQGLDHRLLTDDLAHEMSITKHYKGEYRFSFDHPDYTDSVDKAITLLQKSEIARCRWYVLVGFDTTFQQDIDRLNFLRERNQIVYVQRYNCNKDRKYIPMSNWANQVRWFKGFTWEQFIGLDRNRRYLELIESA